MQFNKRFISITLSLALIASSCSVLNVSAAPQDSYEEFLNKYNSQKYLIKKSQKIIKVNPEGEKEERVRKISFERIRPSDFSENILEIDLHGLSLSESKKLMENLIILINNNKLPDEFDTLRIITGRGNHSPGGKPVLRPKVIEILKGEGWAPEFSSGNNGTIEIKLPIKIQLNDLNDLPDERPTEKFQKELPYLWENFLCTAFKCADINPDAYYNAWKNIYNTLINNVTFGAYNCACNDAKNAIGNKIRENVNNVLDEYIFSHKVGNLEWIDAWINTWDHEKFEGCKKASHLEESDIKNHCRLAKTAADNAQNNAVENVYNDLINRVTSVIDQIITIGASCDPVYINIWKNAFVDSWKPGRQAYKVYSNEIKEISKKENSLSESDTLKNLSITLIKQTQYLNDIISNGVSESILEIDYSKMELEKIKRDFLPRLWKSFYRYKSIANCLIQNDSEKKYYDCILRSVSNASGQEADKAAYVYALDEASKFTPFGRVGNFSFYDAIGTAWKFESGVVYKQVIKKSSSYNEKYFKDLIGTLITQTKCLKKLITDNEFNWNVTNEIIRIPRLKEMMNKYYCDQKNSFKTDAKTLCAVFERTIDVLRSRPARLDLSGPIIIAGDVNGHFNSLKCILNLFFQEYSNDESTQCLFLGNYVDRCARSVERINLLFEFFNRFPDNVYILRENHEGVQANIDMTLQNECINKYGKKKGLTIWKKCNKIFDCLPTTAEEISVAHQENNVEQKWDRFWFNRDFIKFLKDKNLKLIRRIGEGSYGNVWEGIQAGKPVAIKISNDNGNPLLQIMSKNEEKIHIKMLERFGKQNPKNVTLATFTSNYNSLSVIAMPFAELGSLDKKTETTVDEDDLMNYTTMCDIRNLVRQLLKGLKELHDRGIVHNDIKSKNILVTTTESKKCPEKKKLKYLISGFGVSKTNDEYCSPDQQHIRGACVCFPLENYDPSQTFDQAKKNDVLSMGLAIQHVLFRNASHNFFEKKADIEILDEFYKQNPLLNKSEKRNTGVLDLIKLLIGMQDLDPSRRLTLDQARNSKFMKNNYDDLI